MNLASLPRGVLLCMALACVALVCQASLQVGARFPKGIVLGGDGNCTSVNEGTLRYANNRLEVCSQNGTWSTPESLSLASVEELFGSILVQLENVTAALEEIAQDQESTSSPEGQINLIHCLGKGEFKTGMNSFDEDYCQCYADNSRGHFVGARCGFCAEGWARDAFGDCTVDIEDPVLVLSGEANEYVFQGRQWVDPGYEATDNHDGDITNQVVITTDLDMSALGEYDMHYSITDEAGHTVEASRVVHVVEDNSYASLPPTRQSFSAHDECSEAACATRSMTFRKNMDRSRIRVSWHDNLRCRSTTTTSSSCTWEWKINGTSCSDPGPMSLNIHSDALHGTKSANSRSGSNLHWDMSMIAYCNAYGGQPLVGNTYYHLTLHETGDQGTTEHSPYLGWPLNNGGTIAAQMLEVMEIVDTSEYSLLLDPPYVSLDDSDTGLEIPSRRVAFNVSTTGSMVRFSAFDTYDCRQTLTPTRSDGACRIEFLIDGESCVSPGRLVQDMYQNPYHNMVLPATIVGYCNATTSGPITAGSHVLYPIYDTVPGLAIANELLSWNSPAVYPVYEVSEVDVGNHRMSLNFFGGGRNDGSSGEVSSVSGQFYKRTYGSELRVVFSDNFACRSLGASGGNCQWELKVDGMRCSGLNPGMVMNRWTDASDSGSDLRGMQTFVGYCKSLSNGLRVRPGWHNVTLHAQLTRSDWTVGAPMIGFSETTGVIEIEEYGFHLGKDDETAPDIILYGESEVVMFTDAVYTEPGYEAWDDFDGPLTANVTVSGAVLSDTPGIYVLTYEVTDMSGHTASVQRTVTVLLDNMYRSYVPTLQYFPVHDQCDGAECTTRATTVTKNSDTSTFRLVHYDNFRCHGQQTTCKWEWRINGESCTNPGPMIIHTYPENRAGSRSSGALSAVNFHWSLTITFHCYGTSSMSTLPAGSYSFTLHETSGNSPFLGWPVNNSGTRASHFLEVTEMLETSRIYTNPSIPMQSLNSPGPVPDRDVSFVVDSNTEDSMIQFTVYDTWDCRQNLNQGSTVGSCRFEFLVDGESCTYPGPMVVNMYQRPYHNMVMPSSVVMYCNETSSGALSNGVHTLSPTFGPVGSVELAQLLLSWDSSQTLYEIIPMNSNIQTQSFAPHREDTTQNGELGFSATFHKDTYGTAVRFQWSDSFSCELTGETGGNCQWEILIDNKRCESPAGLLMSRWTDAGSQGSDLRLGAMLTGYCDFLEDGFRIRPGWHNVTFVEQYVRSDWTRSNSRIGYYDTVGWFSTEEVPFYAYKATDDEEPSIRLLGDEQMTISVGATYVEAGWEAWDDVDGDITGSVVVTGTASLDTSIAGTYNLDYTATDNNGNNASATRTIEVV